jgi:hypothetical protein
MRNNQENKVGMYNGVITVLDNHNGDSDIPRAVFEARDDLKIKVDKITAKDREKATVTSGKTVAEKQAVKQLIDQLMIVGGGLAGWAIVNNNPEAQTVASVRRSYLVRVRDNELVQKAEQIHQLAEQYISNLVDYGINDETLATLKLLTETYQKALGEQESSMATRVSAPVSLTTLFQESDEILKLRLDPLMETVKPVNPDLYNAYKAARVIKDLRGSAGKRTRVVEKITDGAASGGQY